MARATLCLTSLLCLWAGCEPLGDASKPTHTADPAPELAPTPARDEREAKLADVAQAPPKDGPPRAPAHAKGDTGQSANDAPPLRLFTKTSYPRSMRAKTRVLRAHEHKDEEVAALFEHAGLTFPPRQLHLRAFKKEMELEVWAADSHDGALSHVTTYQICSASGNPGPKRRQGDWQVPEGFYELDLYNRYSRYHLSIRINYPNALDRRLGSTGSAIMIHGDCVSVGCLALTDERIEELWVMTTALKKKRVSIHLFPGRDLEGCIAGTKDPKLAAFWRNLYVGKRLFEAGHVVPKVRSNKRGEYVFAGAK